MNKTIIFILMLSLVIVYGCTTSSEVSFEEGVEKINRLDEKYEADMKSTPAETADVEQLLAQFIGFKASSELVEPLENLIDFKVKFLEAQKLFLEGWQWGKGSTTEYGFGCKRGYARVKEAARLRNESAQKGNEAVEILQNFVSTFPEESKNVNLTQKDVLVLKALYFQVQEKAEKDDRIIESFCADKINQTES